MSNIFAYLLLWWLGSVLYRIWWKLNKINPIYAIVVMWISMAIIGVILMMLNNIKFTNIFWSFSAMSWIAIMACWSILGTLVLMYAMQDNIAVSNFFPSYQIVSLVMVTIVWILLFQEKISLYQFIGIVLSFVSIWLIMKK